MNTRGLVSLFVASATCSSAAWGSTLALGGGDDCGTPDVIVGTGSFAFDTTAATTSAQQQGCGGGAAFDVWFSWVAPATGSASFSTCGGSSADTVLAVWLGSGCSATPIGCNDDNCGLQSTVGFPVTAGTSYMLQLGGFHQSVGTGTFTLHVSTGAANDDCSSATVINGTGSFPFDNVFATTGPQQGLGCGQGTAFNDVWYSWVAPSSGTCIFTLCNGGAVFDTLIAAYAGSGSPGPGTALACNDDSCGLVSATSFDVSAGSSYMLQIGSYSGGTGFGSFDLSILPPPAPCATWDDGSSELLLGWIAGGDMVWLARFGQPGLQVSLGSIAVAWGSSTFPGYGPGNGMPTHLFVYQDGASQDGDPSDATLLLALPTTVSAVDTDTFVNHPIAPLSITGYYFVGSHMPHAAGQYVAPIDATAHPYTGIGWYFGDDTSVLANYANPGANVQPPATLESLGIQGQFLVRVSCSSGPASYLCDPGTGGVIGCPCANPPGGSLRGCNNSSATGGASISGAGSNALSTPTLAFTTAGEKPTATTILLQGSASFPAGTPFGQGVRCVAGALKRMYVKGAVGGSITAPDFGAGDPDIPARSAALGDAIQAGQTRWYTAYYRDPIVLGGCPGNLTFNSTNTAEVQWQ